MRKSFFLCALIPLLVLGGWITISGMEHSVNFYRFYIDGWQVFRSVDDIERYIEKQMAEFRQDDAIVFDEYFEGLEKSLRDQFIKFNEEFFRTHQLVVALIDQGSGSIQYTVDTVDFEDGKLTISILRKSPMIQTMDFVSTAVFLEIPSECKIGDISVKMKTICEHNTF
ncbi:MAG: hypothetical protein FWE31_05145 [Firmicutes bacterium]|nr:hypothetical protein [Bacillota bacterium]